MMRSGVVCGKDVAFVKARNREELRIVGDIFHARPLKVQTGHDFEP